MDTPSRSTDGDRRSTEGCFRGLIDESAVGFYRTKPDGSIVLLNPALEQMLGSASFEEITCRDILRDGLGPEYPRQEFRRRLKREGKLSGLKSVWRRSDGSTIFVSESARIVRADDGTPLYHDGLVENFTELNRAEAELFDSRQMLQLVLDNIPQQVFWKNRDGRYMGGNKALLTVAHLQSVEEVAGKTDFAMPWHPSAPSIQECDQWVMETETPKLNYEEPLIVADGSSHWVRRNKVPLRDQRGRVIGVLGTVEDITAHRQAELKARMREELLTGYFRSSPQGMFLIDRELCLLRANEALAPAPGFSIDQHHGKTLRELLPEVAPAIEPYCARVFSTGEAVHNAEITVPAPGVPNGVNHYLVSLFPVGKEDGLPSALGGIVEDITLRKRQEEKLLLTQFSIDHAVDGVFWVRPDGHAAYVNDAACRVLGYSHEELMSKAIWDVDCVITETTWPKDRDRIRTINPVTFESQVLAKDGRIIPVEFDVTCIHYKGQELFISFMHDLTRRKHIEEELRLTQFAVDHAADQVFRTGADGRIHYVNEAACRMLGYSAEELTSMSVSDVSCDISNAKWPAHWVHLKEQGSLTVEARNRTKDGKILPVEVSMNYLSYAGKEHEFAFVRDMSEHKRTEERLQDSFDQFRALATRLQSIREEERKDMAREIHDQLGQALTAIKLDVSSLAREWPMDSSRPTPRLASVLDQVDEAIRNVRRISMQLRPAILDDLGLAPAITWLAEQFQMRTGITCHVDAPECASTCDPQATSAVFRIFQETLTNVARHAAASRVDVTLKREDAGLVLEVHDNGRGITGAEISEGKSLGILGMRERALSVGGELSLRGSPGAGTTVAVWVPESECTARSEAP